MLIGDMSFHFNNEIIVQDKEFNSIEVNSSKHTSNMIIYLLHTKI